MMAMSVGLANDIVSLVYDKNTLYDVQIEKDEWLTDCRFVGYYPKGIMREEIFYQLTNDDDCQIKVCFKLPGGKIMTVYASKIWMIDKCQQISADLVNTIANLEPNEYYDYTIKCDHEQYCHNMFAGFEPEDLNNCETKDQLAYEIIDRLKKNWVAMLIMADDDGSTKYVPIRKLISIEKCEENDNMGAMKEIAIMVDSLKLDEYYNVEYMDGDVIVKKQHVKYIGKHKDLIDGIEKLVFQHYLSIPNDYDIIISPCMLLNVEESNLKRYHGEVESVKKDNKIQLIKEQWNRDELIIEKAYRLVRGNESWDAILKGITDDYLEFIAISTLSVDPVQILVNPKHASSDYAVYKMGVMK